MTSERETNSLPGGPGSYRKKEIQSDELSVQFEHVQISELECRGNCPHDTDHAS